MLRKWVKSSLTILVLVHWVHQWIWIWCEIAIQINVHLTKQIAAVDIVHCQRVIIHHEIVVELIVHFLTKCLVICLICIIPKVLVRVLVLHHTVCVHIVLHTIMIGCIWMLLNISSARSSATQILINHIHVWQKSVSWPWWCIRTGVLGLLILIFVWLITSLQ